MSEKTLSGSFERYLEKKNSKPSVTVEWLEKWCGKHELRRFEYDSEYVVVREDLLSAVRKQAKVKR